MCARVYTSVNSTMTVNSDKKAVRPITITGVVIPMDTNRPLLRRRKDPQPESSSCRVTKRRRNGLGRASFTPIG